MPYSYNYNYKSWYCKIREFSRNKKCNAKYTVKKTSSTYGNCQLSTMPTFF